MEKGGILLNEVIKIQIIERLENLSSTLKFYKTSEKII